MAERRYQYESRSAARAREQAQLNELAARTAPLVAAGDSFSLLRASRIAQGAREAARANPTSSRVTAPTAPTTAPSEGREQSKSNLGRLADVFRGAVPEGVRDAGLAVAKASPVGDIARGVPLVLSGLERGREASQGFFTGSNPLESAQRFAGGLQGEEYDASQVGFVRHLPEGSRAQRAATFVAEEALDPTNIVAAGAGPRIAARLAGGGRLARLGASIAEPVARGGLATRLAGETAVSVGARAGSELAAEALPEDTPAPLRLLGGVAGGLAGGVAGAGAFTAGARGARAAGAGLEEMAEPGANLRRLGAALNDESAQMRVPEFLRSRLDPEIEDSPVDRIVSKLAPGSIPPPQALAATFGVQEPSVGLTAMQRAVNAIKEAGGNPLRAVVDDDIAAPAFEQRARDLQRIAAVAVRERDDARRIITQAGFDFDEQWRVRGLAGVARGFEEGPTTADLAAHRADFAPYLTPEQTAALGQLEQLHTPYRAVIDDTGLELGSRRDVQEGGFYMHRAYQPDDAVRVSAVSHRAGGKESFEKLERYASQAEAVRDGLTPLAPWDEYAEYVKEVGERATNRYYAAWFRTLEDETGNVIGQTAADRVSPALRGRVERLRQGIAARSTTARAQAVRGREQERVMTEAQRIARRGADLAESAAQRAESLKLAGSTDEAIAAADRELRILEREAAKQARRAGSASKRAETTALRSGQTGGDLARMRADLDAIRGEWDRAKAVAASTPRGRGQIDLTELQGMDFPLRMANAANKRLEQEIAISGRGADLHRKFAATNALMRGLRATMDASFLGIQGAIGAINDPSGYVSAVKAAYRSFGDETALGSVLSMFDERAALTGRLDSRAWAAAGVQQGASATEYTLRGGRVGQALQSAPVAAGAVSRGVGAAAEGSNRMFGTFGDVMRAEYADSLLERALANGRVTLDDVAAFRQGVIHPELRAIAEHVNLTTGWARKPFAGNIGEIMMFAPRFFQSQIELAAKALNPKAGRQGAYARRALGKYLGLAMGATVVINVGLGNDHDYWSPFVNGRPNSNFMRIRVGGRDYSLLGPWDSLLKGIAYAAQPRRDASLGDRAYMLRTKASPVVQMTWDLFTGEDFMGRPVRESPGGFATWLVRQFAPFSLQDAPEELAGAVSNPLGVAGIVADLAGVKSSPLSPTEDLDAVAQRAYGKGFYDLEPYQKETVKQTYPELWKRSVERGSDQKQRAEVVRTELYAKQQTDDQALLDGTLDRRSWRESRASRRDEQRARLAEIYGDDPIENPSNAYERYIAIIQQNTDEQDRVNWEGVDVMLAALPASERSEIEKSVGVGQTPLSKAYAQLIREYVELPRYRGFTAGEAQQIDALTEEINARAGDSDIRKLRALRELAGDYPENVVKAVRKKLLGIPIPGDDARDDFKASNDVLAVLLKNGRLTEADKAVLAKLGGTASAA